MILHHTTAGPDEGPAVVLVGSLGASLAMWQPQVAALAGTHRVIAVDLPGHGRSPVPDGPCTVEGVADVIVELTAALGIERFSVVGLSFGGAVAQALAARHPDRVAHAIVACAAPAYDEGFWARRASAVRDAGHLDDIVAITRLPGRRFSAAYWETRAAAAEASLSETAAMNPLGYAACCDALAAYDPGPVLPAISVPTLVISAQFDEVTPADLGRRVAELVPGARFEVIADAAHLANVEQPEAFNLLLLGHLNH